MATSDPTLLIDADTLLYVSLLNAESEVEWEEDMWFLSCDHSLAKSNFKELLNGLREKANTNDSILCFSSPTNFRHSIDPTYKANRKNSRKPLGFATFKAQVIEEFAGVVVDRLEADDVVGIIATNGVYEDVLIYSIDKDLKQVPGKHLVGDEIIEISPEEGAYWHIYQTLVGDTTDNYPGCPGIGPKKAEAILNKAWCWSTIVELFEKVGLTEEDALKQARLARILQHKDYHYGDIKLWNPNN